MESELARKLAEVRSRFIEAYQSGASFFVLKERFGIPAREIEALRKRYGLPPQPAAARRVGRSRPG